MEVVDFKDVGFMVPDRELTKELVFAANGLGLDGTRVKGLAVCKESAHEDVNAAVLRT